MLTSLRSKLILASVLWTAGLLLLIHMLSLAFLRALPALLRFRGIGPVMLGLALMLAGLVALRAALKPFRRLRERLTAVRAGQDRQLAGADPSEVQPLINDLNALLDDREKAVKRALTTAGDLAHGLKTPLALLAQEAERAGAQGNRELAESIAQHLERMSRQVNYHLARARAVASGPAGAPCCLVAECADALVRALLKLYAGRDLDIRSQMPADLSVRVQREDLDEMLGNILDNACKWGKSKVLLQGSRSGAMVRLTIDDDGPGLTGDLRSLVVQRGVRLDEAAPGSGLGLAIVRDLAELYAGSIALEDSPLGGLRVRIVLPAG